LQVKSEITGKTLIKMPEQWGKWREWAKSYLTKEELLDIATDRLTRPSAYFVPNGKQEQYIKTINEAFKTAEIPIISLFAANQIGKTRLLVEIFYNLFYGVENGWFDYEIFHDYPYPKMWWHVSTKNAISSQLIPMIKEIFPKGRYTYDKEGKSHWSILTTDTGWTLKFFTFDQSPEQFESVTVGGISVDEPAPQMIWKALKSRLSMGGMILTTFTPLECDPYIIDEIERNAGDGKYFNLEASVYDACEERGIRGHRKAKIIDEIVSSFPPDEREARAFGKAMYYKETIYPGLNKDKHFRDPSEFPVDFENDLIYQITDPHDGRYCATIWGAIKPNGRKIIFAETPEDNEIDFWDMKDGIITFEDEIDAWIDVERYHGIKKVYQRIIDKNFGFERRNGSTIARTIYNISKKKGKPFIFIMSYTSDEGEKYMKFGHDKVKESLKTILDDGEPELIIWNTCYHTWNGLTHYITKRARNQHELAKAAGDTKPVPKYKDFPDVVRYFCCAFKGHRDNMTEEDMENYYRNGEKKLDKNFVRNISKTVNGKNPFDFIRRRAKR